MERLNPQQDEVILDAGCGTGRFTLELARKCKKVYAVDYSPRYVEILKERARREGLHNIESFAWDITQPFPFKQRVDKVLSCQVVQHISAERQRHNALQNIYDQLRDGGRAVLCIYNWRPLYARWYVKEGLSARGYYRHRFTPAEAASALQDCGFRKTSVRGYANFAVYSFWKDRFPRVQHLIALGDSFFSKLTISQALGFWLVCVANK